MWTPTMKKVWGYHMFTRFDTIHERDGQTDGQTDRHARLRRPCLSWHCVAKRHVFDGLLKGKKVKAWTLAIAPLTWVRLVTSSALQSLKWQLIGISQWCRSALCGHPLPALTDNCTHGAASRHTIAPISHTRPSPRSRSYYSFPVPLRVGGWVGLSTQ